MHGLRPAGSIAALAALTACSAHAPPRPPPPPPTELAATAANIEALTKQGYKLVDQDGRKLYCRTENVLGSHVEKRTTCMTEQQIRDMAADTRNSLNNLQLQVPPPQGH